MKIEFKKIDRMQSLPDTIDLMIIQLKAIKAIVESGENPLEGKEIPIQVRVVCLGGLNELFAEYMSQNNIKTELIKAL